MSPNPSFKNYPRDKKVDISLKGFFFLSRRYIGYSCLLKVPKVLQLFDILRLLFLEDGVTWYTHPTLDIGLPPNT
jgi:hypothetical protein